MVVGLPRGGVVVAAEVARAFGAPLDVIVVRKLGAPFQQELAMGAIGEDGVRVDNETVMGSTGLRAADIEETVRREQKELLRRARRFREGRARIPLGGRSIVIVDDGIATGSSARAACLVARAQGASRVVLGVPVAPAATASALGEVCDHFVSVVTPSSFAAVGEWYEDFAPTSDDEVRDLLRRSTQP